MEPLGYCSHEVGLDCPNCRTFYVIPNQRQVRPTSAQLRHLKLWIGRTPETEEENEQVHKLRELLDYFIQGHL